MNSNKKIGSASLPIEISDNEMIFTDGHTIFPKIVDQFMFLINENELQIKEIIKLDFCLPPPQYINYSIKEFKKMPGFRKDDNELRINLSIKIVDLCTLAGWNYINDSVIDSVLKIFMAYKTQTINYNDIILLPVHFYSSIIDNNFRLASRLLNNFCFQSDETKQIYIILHINNNHWTVAKLDMESKKIPHQNATLDCGIIVLNYIEQEIGISNQSWSMQQSDYFRIRYLCLTLNCNSEEFGFPQDDFGCEDYEDYDYRDDFGCKDDFGCEYDFGCEDYEDDVDYKNYKDYINYNDCGETSNNLCYDDYDNSMDSDQYRLKSDEIKSYLSKHWESIDEAVKDVKKYARGQGFDASIGSSRHDGAYLRCNYSGKKRENSASQGVHITKFENKHNHEITQDEIEYYSYKNTDKNVWAEIEFFVNQKIKLPQIKNMIKQKCPNERINDKKLDNFVQSVKRVSKNDAGNLCKKLTYMKNNDPEWFVEFYIDDTRRLNRIFWMSPTQLKNWHKYNDIVIIDT
ncbi:4513_t:CDS:2 [Entrophospora sp. SA101]|nr:4513_t:CDS:2 [Entrophospora sp. SA101]CAJ0839304.1 10618_t:CDS:2 [Entrophospora sp. SA101]